MFALSAVDIRTARRCDYTPAQMNASNERNPRTTLLMLSIIIVGDYAGKTTEKVKNRPKFIRNRIIINRKVYGTEQEIDDVIQKQKKK
jgi:hypothetical protein